MITKLVVLLIAVISCLGFVYLLVTGKKYDAMLEPLEDSEFPLKGIYGVGYRFLELIHFDFKSQPANTIREQIKIVREEKYAEFFLRTVYAQRVSLALFVFIIMSCLSCMASEDTLIIFILGVLIAGLVYYYFGDSTKRKIQKLSMQYMNEFPSAVSTIALLVNSGMTLREAWSDVAYSDDTPLSKQMQRVTEDNNSGMSEADALYAFSLRCASPEIKKFTSFIIQGLEKGNKDLVFSLKSQSKELWEVKKQKTLQQGDSAAGKLLIPIAIIFLGILVLIMGPLLSNLGV